MTITQPTASVETAARTARHGCPPTDHPRSVSRDLAEQARQWDDQKSQSWGILRPIWIIS
jgi:hypothetical protein